MAKRKDFSDDDTFNAWNISFATFIDKRFFPQGTRIYLRRKRTANSAISIVDKLRKLPLDTIKLHLAVYHDGEEVSPELIRYYENELLQARKYPESFAQELYSFYMNTAKHIKSNDEMDLFFSLLTFVEDHTFDDQTSDDFAVYTALMDLLLQQMEFLRSDSMSYLKILAGMTTDGTKTLEVDDPFPAIDLPLCELTIMYRQGERVSIPQFLESEYKKLGFPGIRSLDDYELLNEQSRLFISNVNCMAGFINEYTFDMLPMKPLAVGRQAMHAPKLKEYCPPPTKFGAIVPLSSALSTERYLSMLTRHRRRTLPANGVRIHFSNSIFYNELSIKEIYKFGDLYMLYHLTTREGDISGRYNTRTESFISPLNAVSPRPDDFISAIKGLVLWAYTAVTCDDELVQPTNASYHLIFADEQAHIEILSLGNKLQRTDGTAPIASRQLDLEKYENREVTLNGYIRKLPRNQKASERAKQQAKEVGLELADGETYVQPFVRHSWVLRKKEDVNKLAHSPT